MKRTRSGACAVLLLSLSIAHAQAHPHVWVTLHSEVLYAADGAMTGVRHAWTFDDMFSAYALQGIPHAKKGQYTREELASLAHVNVTSLKEYDYFTYARADGRRANRLAIALLTGSPARMFGASVRSQTTLPSARHASVVSSRSQSPCAARERAGKSAPVAMNANSSNAQAERRRMPECVLKFVMARSGATWPSITSIRCQMDRHSLVPRARDDSHCEKTPYRRQPDVS